HCKERSASWWRLTKQRVSEIYFHFSKTNSSNNNTSCLQAMLKDNDSILLVVDKFPMILNQ
ncbi:MAG TPA: hypothetical protein VNW06_11370, partial [Cytophagaceae bacterium]|nr:hypothetical protein [Cytophagaceae bacterium]